MKEENLIFVEEALRFPEVIKLVNDASERIWYKLRDASSFEYACYRNIGIALVEEDVKSVGGIAARIISRAESWYVKNRGKEVMPSLESLARPDEEGEDKPHDVEDVLANIEKTHFEKEALNEKVALLAKDDSRRLATLLAWAGEGRSINDSELAKELAFFFPETVDTGHRRFIQRFRAECQKRLATAI